MSTSGVVELAPLEGKLNGGVATPVAALSTKSSLDRRCPLLPAVVALAPELPPIAHIRFGLEAFTLADLRMALAGFFAAAMAARDLKNMNNSNKS